MTTVRNLAGYKTIIEAEVDISDLHGEMIVYAMVSGRDRSVMTAGDSVYTVSTLHVNKQTNGAAGADIPRLRRRC